MTIKKGSALLLTILGLAATTIVLADATPAVSNDKTSTNATPKYDNGAPDNTTHTAKTSGEPKTVPSGKRHRTHKKSGNGAESANANKTIKATDITPSK